MSVVTFDRFDVSATNPLDILEMIAGQNEWPYERSDDDEITVAVSGEWCDFHIRFFWVESDNLLQAAGMLDMRIPECKKSAILDAINLVNERLAMGHFAIWTEDNSLMFRHSHMVDEGGGITTSICEKITDSILSESNKFYPVFQFVIWAGKSADEAIAAAMLDTVGEA